MNSYVYKYHSHDGSFIVGGYFDAESDKAAAELVRQRESGEVPNTDPWLMGNGPFAIWRHEPVALYDGVIPPSF